ncbi:MAG TPA: glycosyltransferase [Acidobacteriaceae bacterium]|nr:glycosyltransferase [Acidobacteriaceae bacterium]
MAKSRVAIAIVTYNRFEMLRECLAAVELQTARFDEVIVVDNGSTDGTNEWLLNVPEVTVVRQENLGAAGGFSRAMKEGYNRGHDWILCIDDDVMLCPNTLEELVTSPVAKTESVGFLACRVVSRAGCTYMTPPPADRFPLWYDTIGTGGYVRVVSANFAGFMVSRTAIERCGLPIKEFFLWEDDREYSERISRVMPCYLIINSVAVHHQGRDGRDFRGKQLLQVRNKAARILISDTTLQLKLWRLFKYCGWLIYVIICRGYPLACIRLAFVGLFFFRPQIEYVDGK